MAVDHDDLTPPVRRPTTANGVKDVALTPQPKAKRRSALAGVKELAARLNAKEEEVERAALAAQGAMHDHSVLAAELRALQAAYDLVKPQPRARRKS